MRPSPRVRCDSCAFEWFGATVAHGLRIVGSCPRCSGSLTFLDGDGGAAPDERTMDIAPAAVLGTPTSWDR